MEGAKFTEEEPEVAIGPKPGGEVSAKSGNAEQESPGMEIKEEAAGDTSYASSIDAMYPDPSDSFASGLFPGSASFDWSSPDSSSEGRSNVGGVPGQEIYDERASRPGNSRIPGKDHRRYYHNHWRLEYLMDFNARSHSMICMVCGSSLATLKLSTIKRHIRQKHPYSLNWSPCEKEVIIGSWDAHLCVDAQSLAGSEEQVAESMKVKPGPKKKRRRLPPVAKGTWRPILGPECPLPSTPDKTHLEQYMNESIQQWFKVEFLMDYDYQGNKLHCMMCTVTLPSLSLTDIKHHILDNHPTSLQFTPTQKSVILEAWVNRKETTVEVIEGDMTPEMEGDEDMTAELEVEDDMTPDLEVDEDMTPEMEMEDDLDDDEAEEILDNKDVKDERVAQATTKARPECRMLKTKRSSDFMEKDIESVIRSGEENINNYRVQLMEEEEIDNADLELLEEEETITGDVHLLDDEEWIARDMQLLAYEEWKARKKYLLGSGRKSRKHQKAREEEKPEAKEGKFIEEEKEEKKATEKQLLEEKHQEEKEKARETTLLKEKLQKLRDPQDKEKANKVQLLEEEKRDKREKRKVKKAELLEEEERNTMEPQLLGEEKKAAMEDQMLEQEERKTKEAQVLQEEKKNNWEAQLLEDGKREAKEAFLEEELRKEEEKARTRDALLLEEQRVLEALRCQGQDGKLKEQQELSREMQNVERDIVVKVEDHQYMELNENEEEERQTEIYVPAEKQQSHLTVVEGGKTQQCEPEKRVIQVKQAPAVLGIGLPVLKVETPAPILLTRVSVIPEHAILQPSKPKPSTSASDMSKTWRVIAPKLTSGDHLIIRPISTTPEIPKAPAGVDQTVWEVSLWRGTNGNFVQNAVFQMRWHTEHLMDFNGFQGSVVCMYCCSSLSVLKESSIKRHIIQKHPHTANFTAEEKAAIILDWENKLAEAKKIAAKPNTQVVIGDQGINVFKAPDCDPVEPEEEESSWAGVLPEGKGASWDFAFGRLQANVKDPRKYQHDRWKLEFLMDYTPAKDGLICMVCGTILMNPKISAVKMHIQQKHPDTTYLSDQEKAVVMEEWEQKMATSKRAAGQQDGEDEICIEINEDATASETNGSSVAASSPRPEIIVPTFSKTSKSAPSLPPPCNSAKRNYQVRWRTEFMMDYDCRRQGLICMVCGGTLATLKVSTIKRHIVQVHPYSVDFTAEERQRILEAYSEMALHYIHSEECFKTQPQEETKGRKRKSTATDES